jgi:NADH-quinone oxidoreductase subunit L
MGIPHHSWLQHWLEPVIHSSHELAPGVSPSTEWVLMGVSVAGALAGLTVALRFYRELPAVARLRSSFEAAHKVLFNKWYVDEAYEALFIQPTLKLSRALWRWLDVAIIDGIVNGLGRISTWGGQSAKAIQTGSIQVYALVALLGLLLTVGYLIYGAF